MFNILQESPEDSEGIHMH